MATNFVYVYFDGFGHPAHVTHPSWAAGGRLAASCGKALHPGFRAGKRHLCNPDNLEVSCVECQAYVLSRRSAVPEETSNDE